LGALMLEKPTPFATHFGTVAAIISAIVAIASAFFAYRSQDFAQRALSQSIDSESRQISMELLKQFDDDVMGKARLTLQRYHFILLNEEGSPSDRKAWDNYIQTKTATYFEYFVYHKAKSFEKILPKPILFNNDPEKQYEFFRQVDQSRRIVKNFYEKIKLYDEEDDNHKKVITFTQTALKVFSERLYPNAADFLECFWAPVEKGQDDALRGKNGGKTEKILAFYRNKSRKSAPSDCGVMVD
jgi:hypothetical protein